MKIAVLGTRGIPNNYGGFEQFAEYLSLEVAKIEDVDIYVYNPHNHVYQEKCWNGVNIVHVFDPEELVGTVGQFLYDLLCILDARKRKFDIILQLGYTSSSIWGWLYPSITKVVTNMDGLEWKRTKYSKLTQKFLLYAEKMGVRYSHYLISDSLGIQQYLQRKYNVDSIYIPYGANIVEEPCHDKLLEYGLSKYSYSMLIARLEPENNIETILDGVVVSCTKSTFLVIGKHQTKYGEYLKTKYKKNDNIKFLGGIYDIEVLNQIRCYSRLYFHGHTVGGTNPSLLEAMGSGALICAHDNLFNKSILGDDAYYFNTINDVVAVLSKDTCLRREEMVAANTDKVARYYNWPLVCKQYLNLFYEILR